MADEAGLPDFLTVEEAAKVLRIGRTAAYKLAQQWRHSGGREGLPVVTIGRLLRVPRARLEALAGGMLHPLPAVVDEPGRADEPEPSPSTLVSPSTTPAADHRRNRPPRSAHPRLFS